MSTKNRNSVAWQFRLADVSIQSPQGELPRVCLVAVRRHCRGPWLNPASAPQYVRSYFIFGQDGDRHLLPEEITSCAALRAEHGHEITWQRGRVGEALGVVRIVEDSPSVRVELPQLPAFASGDGAKWGISDFYEEKEAALRQALADGQDFTTGWYASKKEIASGCVARTGRVITCSASVSDDFDGEGTAHAAVRAGKQSVDQLFEAIVRTLDKALAEARKNLAANSPVCLWTVLDPDGRWIETYLESTSDAFGDDDGPPGDYYHRWGWQKECKLPRSVRKAFDEFLARRSAGEKTFSIQGYTIRVGT